MLSAVRALTLAMLMSLCAIEMTKFVGEYLLVLCGMAIDSRDVVTEVCH